MTRSPLYGDVLEEFLDQLRAVGINAEQDPARLGKLGKGALIAYPMQMTYDRLNGPDYTMTVEAFIVTGDKPSKDALNDLGTILELVRSVYPVRDVYPDTVQLTNFNRDALPALRITLELSVTEEN